MNDDTALATRAREGDHDAWALLMERHAPRLAAYLGARIRRPKIVEQLVAEAVYAGWRSLDQGLQDPSEFASWFRKLGANLALRWHNKHKEESLVAEFPTDRCGDDESLATEMIRIENGLAGLSEGERMALEQRFRGGLTGEALAEALHVDLDEAERVVAAALKKLSSLVQSPS